jgi:hypothetical protein
MGFCSSTAMIDKLNVLFGNKLKPLKILISFAAMSYKLSTRRGGSIGSSIPVLTVFTLINNIHL